MNEAKNAWTIQIICNAFKPSLFPSVSVFVCLSKQIHSVLGADDKRHCHEKGFPLKPDTPFLIASVPVYVNKKKKKRALYFYEPCDLFCFVVRPLGMHSINFIETRYRETFAYV